MRPPRTIQQLSREELENIVSTLQTALFADTDEKGRVTWKLEKIVKAADVYVMAVDLLGEYGLVPKPV